MAAIAPAATRVAAAVRSLSAYGQPRASLRAAPDAVSLFRPSHLSPLGSVWGQQSRARSAQAQFQESHEDTSPAEKIQERAQESAPLTTQQEGAMARAAPRSLAPAFSDLLGPWFPGDRSLRQMLNTVDRMFVDMVMPPFAALPPMAPMAPFSRQMLRGLGADGAPAVRSPWDVQEDEKSFHLRFDLPGMGKEEVSVKVTEDHMLEISAEHKAEESGASEGERFSSRVARRFRTQVQLPQEIEREGVKAEMRNGVLTVSVPKVEEQAQQQRVIDVPVA